MRPILLGLLCLFSSSLNGQEMYKIQKTIYTLFNVTDARDWGAVEQCFAAEVLLDYSSLTGQEATILSPQQITNAWKTVLPGFDFTHHQLGNTIINSKDKKATALCYGTATHYFENEDGNIWTVVGTYDFELEKSGTEWKVKKMKFNFKYQTGNSNLPKLAMQKLNPKFAATPSLSNAERNENIVRQFFKILEREDANELAELFAEDAQHINPYHSDLFPKGAEGKAAIRDYWMPVFPNFDGMQFLLDEIYTMKNTNMVFVKYKGEIKLKNNAGFYKNDYYSTFKFDADGFITEYVEIFNPILAAQAFGLTDKIK